MRDQRRRNVFVVHWMLLAVFALAPAAVLAQQEKEKPEAAPAKTTP